MQWKVRIFLKQNALLISSWRFLRSITLDTQKTIIIQIWKRNNIQEKLENTVFWTIFIVRPLLHHPLKRFFSRTATHGFPIMAGGNSVLCKKEKKILLPPLFHSVKHQLGFFCNHQVMAGKGFQSVSKVHFTL